MTKQAQNSMKLYKGQNPDTINQLLQFQNKAVVKELIDFFKASDLRELSIKLSLGK